MSLFLALKTDLQILVNMVQQPADPWAPWSHPSPKTKASN